MCVREPCKPTAHSAPPKGRAVFLLGASLENLLTDRRRLMGFVRKEMICSCGCSGYCTVHSLLKVLQWQRRILVDGGLPTFGHDGTELRGGNKDSEEGGLPFKGMVLYIKGAWSEHRHSMGLPSWQNIYHSRPFCAIPKDIRDAGRPASTANEHEHPEKTHEEFGAASSKCERHVIIGTVALRDTIA
eukprot:9038822-Pyramimonas_sp.AAC.1